MSGLVGGIAAGYAFAVDGRQRGYGCFAVLQHDNKLFKLWEKAVMDPSLRWDGIF